MSPTMLVVDDEDDMRRLAELMLATAGYHVVLADSAEAGLQALDQATPDGVLLDLRMPGLGGWGFIDRLRADNRLPGLPVVVMSAHVDNGTDEKVRSLGC